MGRWASNMKSPECQEFHPLVTPILYGACDCSYVKGLSRLMVALGTPARMFFKAQGVVRRPRNASSATGGTVGSLLPACTSRKTKVAEGNEPNYTKAKV